MLERKPGRTRVYHIAGDGALFSMRIIQEALTFDDVLLVPGHSAVLPRDVELKLSLGSLLHLAEYPATSAAMDTVSEARMGTPRRRKGSWHYP